MVTSSVSFLSNFGISTYIYISRFIVEYFMRVNLHQLHFMMPTFSVLLIYPSKISIFVDGYFYHMVSFGSFFSSLQEKEQPDVFAKLLGKAKEVGVDMLVGRAEYCNFHSFICNLAFLIC